MIFQLVSQYIYIFLAMQLVNQLIVFRFTGNCYVGFLEVMRQVDGERMEVMVKCGSAVPLPLTLEADALILRCVHVRVWAFYFSIYNFLSSLLLACFQISSFTSHQISL